MRLKHFINERNMKYGFGLSFFDIDETIFKTFAKIIVKDKHSGKVLKELDNQEFNSYKLGENEEFDFGQFRNAKLFKETSIPIDKTIKRVQRMIDKIESTERGSGSRIIFLTARADFDNKHDVIETFEKYGIKIKKPTTYIERSGNIKTGTVDEKKKQIMLRYLQEGKYRRIRLIDDHKANLKALLDIEKNLPPTIENAVRQYYGLDENEKAIEFFALYVKEDGSLERIN